MKHLPTFFRAAAISNWVLGLSTLFQKAQFTLLELPAPTYPTLIIFMGMLGMVLGVLYWDIAEKPTHRQALLKIGLLGKAGGTIIWLVGLITGDLPAVFFFYALWADFIWLPGFAYFYVELRRRKV